MRSAGVDSSQQGQRSDRRPTQGTTVDRAYVREQGRRARADREEVEARTQLLRAEERQKDAETGHIEAKTAHVASETGDLDFAIFRKGVFFVLAVAVAVILIIRLLTDPNLLGTVGVGGAVALLTWLSRG